MSAYSAIINALELNPSIIADLADEFPASGRSLCIVPGKWSALEHVAHLAQVESVFNARLQQMLENPGAAVVPYDPDQDPQSLAGADWEDVLTKYQWQRAELVGVMRGLDLATWEKPVTHPGYNKYSIRIMARHIALHDLLHGYRIEGLMLAVGQP